MTADLIGTAAAGRPLGAATPPQDSALDLRAADRVAFRLPRVLVRRDAAGLDAYEDALARAGFTRIAGADEAGRGACAGPLVVAACTLAPGRQGHIDGLADSKVLTAAVRERLYEQIVRRAAAYCVVVIPSVEIDAFGLHVVNLAGMRRAVAGLAPHPEYVLTDGFPVPGMGAPSTAVWKGDAVVSCIAAASILAKVTRDRIMTELHDSYPHYDFARHKGYVTADHAQALRRHGPCPQHRFSYINVRRELRAPDGSGDTLPAGLSGEANPAAGAREELRA